MRIGVDTGGTFTDLLAVGPGGELRAVKLPSTRDDPARAVLEAIACTDAEGVVTEVAHGSTVATNALLERRGARVVLLTTEGFEDVLAIRRQNRPVLHALEPALPPPLVPGERRLGIAERVGPRGEILLALTQSAAEQAALRQRIEALHPEAIAIVLLHAYANGRHEARLAEAVAPLGLPLTVSHRLLAEHREYERTSTCVANAFVAPVCEAYLARLEEALAPAHLTVLRSDGGVRSAASAREAPIHTALSGPAAGVTGALGLAEAAGLPRVITLDMGGTSTDVCVLDGEPLRQEQVEVGDLPLRIPALAIHTVGAGGGSVAWADAGGALRVGPRSAGADPGPASYGRGGREPTLTDAHLFLGRLPPGLRLGGRLGLDADAAEAALTPLARALSLSPRACAEGIVRVGGAVMARALRRVSLEQGHDPRDFVLMPFGGAGGLHACELAELLEIPEVVVPPEPGLLCAYGALCAPRRDSQRRSIHLELSGDPERVAGSTRALAQIYAELTQAASTALVSEGVSLEALIVESLGELRYRGQSATLAVSVRPGSPEVIAEALAAFATAHEQAFGFTLPRPVEWVVAAVEARGPRPQVPPLTCAPLADDAAPDAPRHRARARIPPETELIGPLSVWENSGTTWIPAGWRGQVDDLGLLRLRRSSP